MAITLSRRQVLGMGLGAAAGSLVAPSGSRAADFDWMQQKGKSLVVLVSLSPYYTVLQKMVPDFTKLTGIQVEYQVVPEQQLRQKMPIEMNGKSPAVDAFATSLHVEKLLFSQAGWFEPLNKYLENPNLTPPDYNWKDFGPAGTYWGVKGDGTVIALPDGRRALRLHLPEGPVRPEGIEAGDDARRAPGGGQGHAPAAGGLRLHRPRPQERQHPGVGLLPPRARRQLPGRLQDAPPDDVARGGRGGAVLRRAHAELRAAGLPRLQLDGVPGRVRPGPGRVVDRRHVLRGALRGPDEVQGGRARWGTRRTRAAPR